MRDDRVNGPLRPFRREFRIDQQRPLKGEDRPPILHRGEELALSRPRDIIQLGQRKRHAEIVVIPGQDRRRRIQRQLRLARIALAGDDAHLGGARHLRRALQLAEAKEQQIG